MNNMILRTLFDDKGYTVRLTRENLRIQSKATGKVRNIPTNNERCSSYVICFKAEGFASEKHALAKSLYYRTEETFNEDTEDDSNENSDD